MQRKISIVHSGTGHYVEFYMDFDADMDNEEIYDYIINDVYVEVENV
jgi:hypothetical protein